MNVDLHFHSKYSDGNLWPVDLVAMAKNKGLEMIALTDHDSFEGVPDFIAAADEFKIKGIPAIEIDFKDEKIGFKSELLGYFPLGNYPNTKRYIAHFRDIRKELAIQSIDKAKKTYRIPDLSLDELLDDKLGKKYDKSIKERISITKPDILRYFNRKNVPHGFIEYTDFKKGYFNDELFKRLSKKPDLLNCLKMIDSDDGFAVLAHPAYQFNKDTEKILLCKDEYIKKLKEAKKYGLWGIELHAYESENEATAINAIILQFADECGLQVTYGSDYHGANTGNTQELGCLKSDFKGFNPNYS